MRTRTCLAAISLLSCAACFLPFRLFPESRDPRHEAQQRERDTCPPSGPPDYPSGLFDPRTVNEVAPLYATMSSGRSGTEKRLIGVTLRLRPLASITSEYVESMLNCHNARRELGRAGEPSLDHDPYWVPGRQIHISADFEHGVLRILLKGPDLDTAKELLRRATLFRGAGSA